MKVHFYLDNSRKQESSIFLTFRFQGTTYKIATGRTIPVKHWSRDKERVKRSFPEGIAINEFLESFAVKAANAFNRLSAVGEIPSPSKLKEVLNPEEALPKNRRAFFPLYEQYIEESKGIKRENSLSSHRSTLNHLKEFEKAEVGKIQFDRIDLGFYNRFVKYLNFKLNLSLNTSGTYVKNLKVFLKYCNKNGYSAIQNLSEFKVMEENSESVYLNPEEIKTIFELDLSKRPGLIRTRELFVIGCWTGLRFSDLCEVQPGNIRTTGAGSLLKVKTMKTGEEVIIPLHPMVLEIISRNGGEIPGMISNQKMNENLKEIGRLANLTEKVATNITKGGKRQTTFSEKWELISTHTARRSFATNQYNAGISSIDLMKITGHKTETSFLKYIRIDKEEAASRILKMWNSKEPVMQVVNS